MTRPRRPQSRTAPRFSTHQATHSLGLHLLLALVLLTAMAVFSGCRITDDTDEAPAPERTASTESGPGEAVTPIDGYDQVDPQRLDAERYDSSWRDYATRDRESRSRMMRAGNPPRRPPVASDEPNGETDRTASEPAPSSGNPSGATDRSGALGSGADGSNGESSQPTATQDETKPKVSGGGASKPMPADDSKGWDALAPDAFDGAPSFPIDPDGSRPTVLRLQVLLDRAHFSPGIIDGRWGKNSEKAVYWMQDSLGLDPTGQVDQALYDRLRQKAGGGPLLREHALTAADLEGPFIEIPEETKGKAELDCLCYESVEEKLAEMFHATSGLLEELNPDADFSALSAGDTLVVPAVEIAKPGEPGKGGTGEPVARILISKGGFYLQGLDENGDILYHFPITLGSEYDPSPEGDWKVTGIAWKPNFHYQPKLFSDVPDTEEDLMLPPGPNSPVGLIWMSLSKENYGIHGTAEPETIGYTSSHGCIRLTNWDAIFLGHHVDAGTPVQFTD